MKSISYETIRKALDWSYDKAVNGVAGLDSAQELAESYLKKHANVDDAIKSLVRWQITKATTSGFLTGLPGVFAIPVTLPANITSVLYIQIRMIAAIAYMKGNDIKSDQVKALVYVCLVGNGAIELLKGVGITIGEKLTQQFIKNISTQVIKEINKKVGFRLLTKFGEKGVVNLGKLIPVLGGIFGGTVDAVTTRGIAKISQKVFL
jgi:uncharacterized protein (DUF697 family)